MVKFTVIYPNADGCRFDMAYYLNTHVPMVRERLGAALKGVSVEEGIDGGIPDTPLAFVAIAHFVFDSLEAFHKAFALHAAEIAADVPKYTNIEPTVQLSEIKL